MPAAIGTERFVLIGVASLLHAKSTEPPPTTAAASGSPSFSPPMIKNDIANINTVVNFKSSANISYQVRYKEYTGTAIMKAKDKEVYGCGASEISRRPPSTFHPVAPERVFSCFRVFVF